ncbi:hypothetical protein NMG60_11022344 [Bertholletia excelsa]
MERELIKLLEGDKIRTIILTGEAGIGKTWTARRITNTARKKELIEVALWIPPMGSYDKNMLWDCIANQYFPLSTNGESTDDKANELKNGKIEEELRLCILNGVKKLKLLLVFDDEGYGKSGTSSEDVLELLKEMLELDPLKYKVLIIRRNEVAEISETMASNNITEVVATSAETEKVPMWPLEKKETLSLLEERAGTRAFQRVKKLDEAIFEKTKCIPAAILLVAKAVSYFSQKEAGVEMLEHFLEEVKIKHLFECGYELQPKELQPNKWMLEGYLGDVDSVEKAYEKGHQVLMELLDCRILKKVNGDYVLMEGARERLDKIVMQNEILSLDDCYRRGFCGIASLGLANMLGEENGKEVRWSKKFSFSLIDDNGSSRKFVSSSFESLQELHVIASFNPTEKTLFLSSDLKNPVFQKFNLSNKNQTDGNKSLDPYVLVFRGCHFLEKVDLNSDFNNLTVLEISGPSPLKSIPAEIFRRMPKLQSLNLSALQIDSLPTSLFELADLRWLILRNCYNLETLRSIKKCKNLMVIDLSGARLLNRIEDKIFAQNSCLQMLNFSETKIKRFPIVNNLPKLTHLLLRGCTELLRLPFIHGIKTLEVLDLSGSCKVEELKDQTLENLSDLEIFDLSGTAVANLPSNLGNPHHLSLKECAQLEDLAFIGRLKRLKVLDVSKAPFRTLPSLAKLSNLRRLSLLNCPNLVELPDWSSLEKLEELNLQGCSALKELQGTSFEKLSCLQRLDLSDTLIKRLPSLSSLTNLRHLLLKRCAKVKEIPELRSLSKLQELNLCGVKHLGNIVNGDDFLKNMSQLQILDLSETELDPIPSLSNLTNLSQLYLRGFPSLREVRGLEALTELEVLDLSGTSVDPSSYLAKFTKLHQVLLQDVEKSHQSEGCVTDTPPGFSEVINPEDRDLQGAGSSEEEISQCSWAVSHFPIGTDGIKCNLPLTISGSQFLKPSLQKRFPLSIHPINEQDKNGIVRFYTDDFPFMDIYLRSKMFKTGLEDVRGVPESVFLIDNASEKWFSFLGASNLKKLEGCWIERCSKMGSILRDEEAEEMAKLGSLKVLWVSNCVNLNHIYHGNWQIGTFQNLKHLFIDCCPQLSFVFSSSWQPINIKVLHIKFCDKLKTVFEPNSTELLLPELMELYLWELPELEKIGCQLPPEFELKKSECPKLEKVRRLFLDR